MLRSLVTSIVALLFLVSAVAAAGPGKLVGDDRPSVVLGEGGEDPNDDDPNGEDPNDEDPNGEGGPPPDVQALVEANQAHAAERAAAAQAHAQAILAWTSCIAANAANPENLPRDDTFDPKVGCEQPAPPTDPNDPEDEVEVETDDGPPENPGAPDGAGPPDWIPGPPPGAGPGSDDED